MDEDPIVPETPEHEAESMAPVLSMLARLRHRADDLQHEQVRREAA